jgi:hypothetical protein
MSSKSAFFTLLMGFKFAANANVAKLLKKDNPSDGELAVAVKTTKQYKESKELQDAATKVINDAEAPKPEAKPEPAKATSTRSGERRGW